MLLLLLLAVAADSPKPTVLLAPPIAKCRRPDFEHAGKAVKADIRPLAQEPLARQERAVAYSEQGCIKPVIVRENIGG